MGEEMKARGAADIFKWWLFMASDIIGELSFGESFHALEQGEVSGGTGHQAHSPPYIITHTDTESAENWLPS